LEILCVGQLVTDVLAVDVEYTDLGQDTTAVDKISLQSGGDSMNVAIALAKLGSSVGFCGKTGNDIFGEFLRGEFINNDVDIRGLTTTEKTGTSTCIVLINSAGNRVFLYSRSANACLSDEDIDDSLLNECKHLHISGTFGLPEMDAGGSFRLLKRAKSLGKSTSMDVTWDNTGRWMTVVEPMLPYIDLFLPSENEASRICGTSSPEKMAVLLREKGVGMAVIKLGGKGAYVDSGSEKFYQPAYPVTVVDTTGAGDSFVAGFLSQYIRGASLRYCTKFAAAVASYSIMAVGATANIPDEETVIKKIEDTGE